MQIFKKPSFEEELSQPSKNEIMHDKLRSNRYFKLNIKNEKIEAMINHSSDSQISYIQDIISNKKQKLKSSKPIEKLHPVQYDIVFVLGIPLAGKATICAKLAEKISSIAIISTGSCLREARDNPENSYSAEIKSHISAHTLVPGYITAGLLHKKMNSYYEKDNITKFIIIGFPKSFDNFYSFQEEFKLENKFTNKYARVITVVNFIVDTAKLLERIVENEIIKTDNDETKYYTRSAAYHNYTEPIMAHFKNKFIGVEIENNGSIGDAYIKFLEQLALDGFFNNNEYGSEDKDINNINLKIKQISEISKNKNEKLNSFSENVIKLIIELQTQVKTIQDELKSNYITKDKITKYISIINNSQPPNQKKIKIELKPNQKLGKITTYHSDKGYGFINDKHFFYISEVEKGYLKSKYQNEFNRKGFAHPVKVGDEVLYELKDTFRGFSAVNIEMMNFEKSQGYLDYIKNNIPNNIPEKDYNNNQSTNSDTDGEYQDDDEL